MPIFNNSEYLKCRSHAPDYSVPCEIMMANGGNILLMYQITNFGVHRIRLWIQAGVTDHDKAPFMGNLSRVAKSFPYSIPKIGRVTKCLKMGPEHTVFRW